MNGLGLVLACIAIFCNVGAQLAIKFAGNSLVGSSLWMYLFSPMLILAVVLYGISFVLTVRIYALNDLSIAAPFMAGGAFLLVALSSVFFFAETMDIFKILGMFFVVTGLIFLSH